VQRSAQAESLVKIKIKLNVTEIKLGHEKIAVLSRKLRRVSSNFGGIFLLVDGKILRCRLDDLTAVSTSNAI